MIQGTHGRSLNAAKAEPLISNFALALLRFSGMLGKVINVLFWLSALKFLFHFYK
jgi:hypothetical protein